MSWGNVYFYLFYLFYYSIDSSMGVRRGSKREQMLDFANIGHNTNLLSLYTQGRHFNFFFGAKFDYWKIGKKQHFICSNLTLFIVPFFLFSLFSLFSLFLFFFFCLFSFSWGATVPQPPQMTPLYILLLTFASWSIDLFCIWTFRGSREVNCISNFKFY